MFEEKVAVVRTRTSTGPELAEEYLSFVAKLIRGAYLEEVERHARFRGLKEPVFTLSPLYDGGLFVGTLNKPEAKLPIWPRLAKFVYDNRLHPVEYVRTLFRMRRVQDGSFPRPEDLGNRSVFAWYLRDSGAPDDEADLQASFRSQCGALSAKIGSKLGREGWSAARIRVDALTDRTLQLSSLFRYCLAVQYAIFTIAQQEYFYALVQYMQNKDLYDKAWSELIPDRLRKRGEKLQEALAVFRVDLWQKRLQKQILAGCGEGGCIGMCNDSSVEAMLEV